MTEIELLSGYKGILAELITTIFEYFQWNLLIFMVTGLFYKQRETVVISRSLIPLLREQR